MKMQRFFFTVICCFALQCLPSCNPLAPILILGPLDRPNIATMNWTSLELTYWVKIDEITKEARVITITDEHLLNTLRHELKIKNIRGISIPYGGQFTVKTEKNGVWNCNFVFKDEIGICKQSDNYYSYNVELSNIKFFQHIKRICLINERIKHPQATSENIILRRNMSLKSYRILHE